MSVKFNEIMKKFYEDEMLGIQSEVAPANSVASGGVDMAPNAVSKKKQKEIQKKAYDGRTKEARAFMKRMLELKAKRESNFRKSVKENLYTAFAITHALDKVRPDTRKKMEDIINNGGKSQFLRLVNVVFK